MSTAPSLSAQAQTAEAHQAVDSVLRMLLQWNLAVDALSRDMTQSCAVNSELLQWCESIVADSDAAAAAYARAERQAAATAALAPSARAVSAASATTTSTAASTRKSVPQGAPAAAAPKPSSAQRAPSPAPAAVSASSRPPRPLPDGAASLPAPVAAVPSMPTPSWTPTPAAGASTAAIHASQQQAAGVLAARPGRRQYAEHATRPTLLSDEDLALARGLNGIEIAAAPAATAAAAIPSSAADRRPRARSSSRDAALTADDDETAYWSGPLPVALASSSSSSASAVDSAESDEPSGLFGAPPRINKAQMLSPYLAQQKKPGAKGSSAVKSRAGSKATPGSATGTPVRQSRPAHPGAASAAGAARPPASSASPVAHSFTPSVATAPASASHARRSSSGAAAGPQRSAAGVSGASGALDLDSILRLAGRAHAVDADEDDSAASLPMRSAALRERAHMPHPPPPPPMVPAVPAPHSAGSSSRSAASARSAGSASSSASARASSASAIASAAPAAAAPAPAMGPHRAFLFPPDFLADLESLKHARAHIAQLEERRKRGELAGMLGTREHPDSPSAAAALAEARAEAWAARELLGLDASHNAGFCDPPTASLYPPPPFSALSSFPSSLAHEFASSSTSSSVPPPPPAQPAPFRYPLLESDLSALKSSLWAGRRSRAQENRQATGGLEPSESDVVAAAVKRITKFERRKHQLLAMQVRAQVEQGVRQALGPVLKRFLPEQRAEREHQAHSDDSTAVSSSSPRFSSELSTPEQLSVLRLSYALLRVGGRLGPVDRFGGVRKAMPCFLPAARTRMENDDDEEDEDEQDEAAALPACMRSHHLWSAHEEAEEAERRAAEDEDEEVMEDINAASHAGAGAKLGHDRPQ